MVRSKEDLMSSIKERIGNDTSDENIALIEDISDTINDFEQKTQDSTDWKAKYEENDKAWRDKYTERFFSAPVQNEPSPSEPKDPEPKKPMSYDDLFKVER